MRNELGTGGTPPQPAGYVPPGQPGTAAGSPNPVIRARQVIVSGPSGAVVGVFVYAAGTTPGAGNEPIASMTNQTADPFTNPTRTGVAAYTLIAGDQIAVQLGQGSFAGTPAAGLFTHDMTAPANSDPFIGALNSSSAFCTAAIFSGKTTGGATGAGVECADSVTSGVSGGTVNVVGGQLLFQGGTFFDGTTLTVTNATVTGSLSVAGSTSTGAGDNGGVTSGPSGTVNSFPAAGPNHTHAEVHHHPL